MGNRPLDWIRRQTTAHDLLDDGVENFSDLRGTVPTPLEADAPANPDHLRLREHTVNRLRAEQSELERRAFRHAFSAFGIVLGLVIASAGFALTLHPVDMLVHHARVRYLRPVVEHVTPVRSRIYGSSLVICGLALVVYSARRPRKL